MRRLLLVALLLWPITAGATSPGKAKRAVKAVESALAHVQKNDLSGAYTQVERAIKLDPANVDAHFLRALILLEGAKIAGEPMLAAEMQRAAREDLTTILQVAPESETAQKASALLDAMRGGDLFPLPSAECSAEATQAMEEAEARLSAGDLVQARGAYARATEACPQNAVWWTWYGDVFFQQKDFARAGEMYKRALAIEPCFWTAHRFLADAQQKGGDESSSYYSLMRAVSCNPNYDDAWNDLVGLAAQHQVTVERPELALPAEVDDATAAPVTEEAIEAEAGRVYARALVRASAADPLGRRREAVQAALTWLDDGRLGLRPERPGLRAWAVLSRARATGYLDEAILILLLDAELLPQLKTHQAEHLDRLVGFVRTTIAPVPGL